MRSKGVFKTTALALLISVGITGCATAEAANKPSTFKTSVKTISAKESAASTKATSVHKTSTQLKDANWIADPVNYEVTKTRTPNYNLSVPILMYHEAKYKPGDIITLKPGQFASEMSWLHSHDFHPVNLGQLYAAMYYGYKLPSRPIVLSFDDGYESWYLDAFPVLKKYNFQATGFVISSFMNKTTPNRTIPFPKLTVPEIQEMQKSGIWDIESHTVSHLNLATISASSANDQLKMSKIAVTQMTGHPTLFFCYPDGGYNSTDVNLVKHNEYLLATTMRQGYANLSQGPETLDRIGIYSDTTLSDYANLLAQSLTLRYGSQGPDVTTLQERLNQLGYNVGKPNGIYGEQTVREVEAFQAAHHLTADGVAGPQTQSAMGL